ncbi:hypothetical protein BC830DRAFT_1129528 [Chytriomyces sp. MP71]|nr:hypothetical protein BC830DRAFT_1129528 [Chytriomyces sp. MP71]
MKPCSQTLLNFGYQPASPHRLYIRLATASEMAGFSVALEDDGRRILVHCQVSGARVTEKKVRCERLTAVNQLEAG